MDYFCPECRSKLNVAGRIVLIGKRMDQRGLFAFAEPTGDYDYEAKGAVDRPLDIQPGTIWDFSCPVCHSDLTTPVSERLAHLRRHTDERAGDEVVVFSKVADEQATFVVRRSGVEPYGIDHPSYLELSIQKHYW